MKFEDILKTSRNILTNTYSLYVKSDTNSYRARYEMTKCLKLLTELCACMENFITYLLKDFQEFKRFSKSVLKNKTKRKLLIRTKNIDSVRNIALTRRAKFIWKESSILKKKIKQSMIKNNIWYDIKFKK
jgi:hypothetical protein